MARSGEGAAKLMLSELSEELLKLLDARFTGSLSLTIRLHQGGVTAAVMGKEHFIRLDQTK